MSDESTQPATEHHVGTLDLSGEGNRAEVASLISDEAIAEIAGRMFDGDLVRQPQRMQDRVWRDARAALVAAYPAIREQVAEEIAVAIGIRRDEVTPGRPGWVYLTEAIRITREIGDRDLDATAPGGAGGASGRTGLSASPSDPQAGKAGRNESGGFEG